MRKLYAFNNKKSTMIKVSFQKWDLMDKFIKLFKNPINIEEYGHIKFDIFESQVSILDKFFGMTGVRLGVIACSGYKLENKQYIVNWTTVKSIEI